MRTVKNPWTEANMNATVFRSREPPVDDEPKLQLCWIIPE